MTGDGASNVEHGDVLVALAEAMVNGERESIRLAREAVAEAMGAQAMVDAVGVAANFERMVRIADATGIPLGDKMEEVTAEVRRELDLDRLRKA